jgi:LemA protein
LFHSFGYGIIKTKDFECKGRKNMIFVAAIIIIAGIYITMSYNGFVQLQNIVEEAFSTMDVYLKKRYDLIPNLVETVKGYATHESKTLENVIEKRNMAMGAGNMKERQKMEGELTGALKTIFALSESYPDLKANGNFMKLQGQLETIEGDILQSRKYYNGVVRSFNTKCETFPSLIVAKIFSFTQKEYFEITEEKERSNVQVKF